MLEAPAKERAMIIQSVPNPDMLVYHIRKRLIDGVVELFESKDWKALDEADEGWLAVLLKLFPNKLGREFEQQRYEGRQKCAPLVDALFMINGIEKVYLGPHSISVIKGHVFSWEELKPKILTVLSVNGLDGE